MSYEFVQDEEYNIRIGDLCAASKMTAVSLTLCRTFAPGSASGNFAFC